MPGMKASLLECFWDLGNLASCPASYLAKPPEWFEIGSSWDNFCRILIAWTGRDSAWWWVLHFTGALAGLCAVWIALDSVPADEGTPDQAEQYFREDR